MRAILFITFFPLALHAEPFVFTPTTILDTLVSDWNNDAMPDMAVLNKSEPEAGPVTVYLSIYQGAEEGDLRFMGDATDIIEIFEVEGADIAFGEGPYIAFSIHSKNNVEGADRREIALAIQNWETDFKVASYRYQNGETTDLNTFQECDINLSLGEGVIRDGEMEKQFSHDIEATDVYTFEYQVLHEECEKHL